MGETAVVIIGAGVAGATAAATLRQVGFAGPITLIGDERHFPYQRPPLSKAYLLAPERGDVVPLRPAEFWEANRIELITGSPAAAIDRGRREVQLSSGRRVGYDELILAIGARNRPMPGAVELPSLRTHDEALALRERLAPGTRLVVIGGGFIGLEVAASARERDVDVTVVEALDRVMARVASEELSSFIQAKHEQRGVRVLTGQRVREVRADAVVLDLQTIPADTVLAGVGVVPNVELAEAAGLEVDNGIVVDEWLRTSDPAISAAGDCTQYPCEVSGRRHRLESIQNATDQARMIAERISGSSLPYRAVPWFWSDQFDSKLRIAGVAHGPSESVIRGDIATGSFSIGRFVAGRLVAVESVNQMPDHMGARKLLGLPGGAAIDPGQFADPGLTLRELATSCGKSGARLAV